MESLQQTSVTPDTAYTFNLAGLLNLPRASAMAPLYQEYRIKKVEYRWKPFYNQYNPVGATPISKPQLFKMQNTNGENLSFSGVNAYKTFQAYGCKAIAFTKNVKATWAPNALVGAYSTASGGGVLGNVIKKTPWLRTGTVTTGIFNVDQTQHLGMYFLVQQDQGTVMIPVATTECTVVVEFRKPYLAVPLASEALVPAVAI